MFHVKSLNKNNVKLKNATAAKQYPMSVILQAERLKLQYYKFNGVICTQLRHISIYTLIVRGRLAHYIRQSMLRIKSDKVNRTVCRGN